MFCEIVARLLKLDRRFQLKNVKLMPIVMAHRLNKNSMTLSSSQKLSEMQHYNLCDNIPNCVPIQIIFGRNIAEKICN